MGGYGRHRELEEFFARAVSGGTGVNGLKKLLLQSVWTGEGVRLSLSLCPHIEVNISCTRGFVKDVIVRGRRCSDISLYPHINIVITYNPRQCP